MTEEKMVREIKMENIARYYVTLAYEDCFKNIENLSTPEAIKFYNYMIRCISKEIAEILEETT